MSKGERENMGTETEGCVLDIHLGGETHFDLRCLTVMEKSVTNKGQSNTAHMQCLACASKTESMHVTPTAARKVILMLPPLGIYIEGEARQATYRLTDWIVDLLEQDLAIRRFSKRWLMSGHIFWPQGTKSFLLLLLEEGF
jgi:hypothetical protein